MSWSIYVCARCGREMRRTGNMNKPSGDDRRTNTGIKCGRCCREIREEASECQE